MQAKNAKKILFAFQKDWQGGRYAEILPQTTEMFMGKETKMIREFEEFSAMSEEEKLEFDVFVGFHGKATTPILDYYSQNHPEQLKWVHSLMAGVEPFVRSEAFRASPIPLSNARTAFKRSLGEFVMLSVLHHTKNVPLYQEQQA
jgi:phosphoglycerate dehydrogenase-like enzyme